jgi:hypothetical protein
LHFEIGDYEYSVPSSEYLLDGAILGYPGKCILAVTLNPTNDQYILGTAFLRNYYTVYDQSTSKVGLALHINSNANVTKKLPGWAIFLIILLVISVVGGISFFLFKKYYSTNQTFTRSTYTQV